MQKIFSKSAWFGAVANVAFFIKEKASTLRGGVSAVELVIGERKVYISEKQYMKN